VLYTWYTICVFGSHTRLCTTTLNQSKDSVDSRKTTHQILIHLQAPCGTQRVVLRTNIFQMVFPQSLLRRNATFGVFNIRSNAVSSFGLLASALSFGLLVWVPWIRGTVPSSKERNLRSVSIPWCRKREGTRPSRKLVLRHSKWIVKVGARWYWILCVQISLILMV